MLGACFINIWGLRLLPTIDRAAIFWYVSSALIIAMLTRRSMTGAVIIIITCLSCASPNFQSADFVFTRYINDVGWNNGVAWILGLLQSMLPIYSTIQALISGSFGLTGYDAVSHMVEEMPNPHLNAPKTMVAAVLIGASSSFVFLICLLFSMQDVDLVNSSPAGALLETMYQATSSRAGAVCLQVSRPQAII